MYAFFLFYKKRAHEGAEVPRKSECGPGQAFSVKGHIVNISDAGGRSLLRRNSALKQPQTHKWVRVAVLRRFVYKNGRWAGFGWGPAFCHWWLVSFSICWVNKWTEGRDCWKAWSLSGGSGWVGGWGGHRVG